MVLGTNSWRKGLTLINHKTGEIRTNKYFKSSKTLKQIGDVYILNTSPAKSQVSLTHLNVFDRNVKKFFHMSFGGSDLKVDKFHNFVKVENVKEKLRRTKIFSFRRHKK